MSVGAGLFWLATALLAWVYVGYPAFAAVAGRLRPFRIKPGAMPRPLVTVGIAAHDEARHLRARISDILAQRGEFDLEVIVASDGSTDASAAILERLASAEPRLRYVVLDRVGQTGAQAEIFRMARGEIVVLSDAETRFAPACLARLVAPFADTRVGATTGRLAWEGVERTETSRAEGAYWRYEQAVRRLESRAGWLTAVTGALLAVRRDVYRPVPAHASMDHLLPLYVRDAGLTVLAVTGAIATDRPISGLRAQFRNRTRTATRGIRANLSMAGRLTPWRRPSAALAIWSHKVLRWATPWLAGVALLGAMFEVVGGNILFAVPLLVAAAGLATAIAAWLLRRRRIRPPRPVAFALAVAIVNAAFFIGWLNVLRGERIEAWHRTEWRAGTSGSSGSPGTAE